MGAKKIHYSIATEINKFRDLLGDILQSSLEEFLDNKKLARSLVTELRDVNRRYGLLSQDFSNFLFGRSNQQSARRSADADQLYRRTIGFRGYLDRLDHNIISTLESTHGRIDEIIAAARASPLITNRVQEATEFAQKISPPPEDLDRLMGAPEVQQYFGKLTSSDSLSAVLRLSLQAAYNVIHESASGYPLDLLMEIGKTGRHLNENCSKLYAAHLVSLIEAENPSFESFRTTLAQHGQRVPVLPLLREGIYKPPSYTDLLSLSNYVLALSSACATNRSIQFLTSLGEGFDGLQQKIAIEVAKSSMGWQVPNRLIKTGVDRITLTEFLAQYGRHVDLVNHFLDSSIEKTAAMRAVAAYSQLDDPSVIERLIRKNRKLIRPIVDNAYMLCADKTLLIDLIETHPKALRAYVEFGNNRDCAKQAALREHVRNRPRDLTFIDELRTRPDRDVALFCERHAMGLEGIDHSQSTELREALDPYEPYRKIPAFNDLIEYGILPSLRPDQLPAAVRFVSQLHAREVRETVLQNKQLLATILDLSDEKRARIVERQIEYFLQPYQRLTDAITPLELPPSSPIRRVLLVGDQFDEQRTREIGDRAGVEVGHISSSVPLREIHEVLSGYDIIACPKQAGGAYPLYVRSLAWRAKKPFFVMNNALTLGEELRKRIA